MAGPAAGRVRPEGLALRVSAGRKTFAVRGDGPDLADRLQRLAGPERGPA